MFATSERPLVKAIAGVIPRKAPISLLPIVVTEFQKQKVNGVSHEELTGTAYRILLADLERWDNKLGELQKEALYELVGTMTFFAQGSRTGRRAFNLGTGCGKTSAIIAWIAALYRLGLNHVAVSVAASKIEALCTMKRQLMAHGIPEELIGLKHSHQDASLPSTGNDDRRFQLVTHARVRGGTDHDLFMHHQGKERAVMIYWVFRSIVTADSGLS